MGEEKKGFFRRLVSGLTKTRDNIVSGMDSIFHGFSRIDDDFYEELEETLIMGDLGVRATMDIIEDLKEKVKERRSHKMEVPLLEGGHLHDYFCPVHNLSFSFEWDKPNEHYCSACKKYWKGNKRYDWAWINKVHAENLQYLENCTYLYLATVSRTISHIVPYCSSMLCNSLYWARVRTRLCSGYFVL